MDAAEAAAGGGVVAESAVEAELRQVREENERLLRRRPR
eukprot:gene6099-24257_t